MKLRCALMALGFLVTSPALSQSLSLEELKSQIDSRVNDQREYEALLRDSDPMRAAAAFQVIMESGDDNIVRLALSIGAFSPVPLIRQTALSTFFARKPNIVLFIDGTGISEEGTKYWPNWMQGLGGSAGAKLSGTASFSVGDWSDEEGCYINRNALEVCLARVNATTVSVYLYLDIDGYRPHGQWMNLMLSAVDTDKWPDRRDIARASARGRYRTVKNPVCFGP